MYPSSSSSWAPCSCLLAAFVLLCTTVHAKVHMSVYYESHCPDSHDFIRSSLYPVWKKIDKYVDLNLIPFGKARSTRNGFECQHGPKECRSNLYQSCVLSFLQPGTPQIEFVYCFMANPDDYNTCIDRAGLSEISIKKCIHSDLGRQLQLHAERETMFRIPRLRFVPTVVFNKTYYENDQRDIESYNFRRAFCRYEPKACG